MTDSSLLWTPSARATEATRLHQFLSDLVARGVVPPEVQDAHALQRWSVSHPEQFWAEVWRAADIMADGPGSKDAP